jgi:hypothetical protein
MRRRLQVANEIVMFEGGGDEEQGVNRNAHDGVDLRAATPGWFRHPLSMIRREAANHQYVKEGSRARAVCSSVVDVRARMACSQATGFSPHVLWLGRDRPSSTSRSALRTATSLNRIVNMRVAA